jgi:RNA-binding protein 5/10
MSGSRSRSWSRSRSRSRSRERRRRRRSRTRSRSRERSSRWEKDDTYRRRSGDRSRDGRDGARERRDGSSRDHGSIEDPTVIMLRNIRESVLKEDIAKALGDDVSFARDIRLVTRKGSSSFAFVEFYDAKDSARWMEKIEADPLYLCGSRVDVDYSRAQRDQWRDRNNESRDWVCFKCNTVNFSRRRFCMTCDCTRTESDQLHEDVRSGKDTGPRDDNAPSNVLIMKGLDVNSTESSIRGALASLEGLQQPVDVRIIRDHVTSASRGFCFLEFSTGEITSMALRKMLEQTPAFFVDGKRITVTFARGNNPKSMGTHKVANAAIAQAQWSMSLAPQLNSNPGQTQTSQQGTQWQQAPVQYSQPPASTQQDQVLWTKT